MTNEQSSLVYDELTAAFQRIVRDPRMVGVTETEFAACLLSTMAYVVNAVGIPCRDILARLAGLQETDDAATIGRAVAHKAGVL